jgi:hypothetical protein
MTPIKLAGILISLSTLYVSTSAFAEWTCPSNDQVQQVIGIGYDTDWYQPRIHFQSQSKGDWSYLAYSNGVNKDYGKAMLAIALTAYFTGAKVRVRCTSQSVNGLWITDDGSKSPN